MKPRFSITIDQRTYTLGNGRHLIGDSALATIPLDDKSDTICAAVVASDDQVTLKSLTIKPAVIVNMKHLSPSEQVVIADAMEFQIGAKTVRITILSVEESVNRAKEKAALDNASAEHCKQEIAKLLLDELDVQQINLADINSPRVKEMARLRLKKITAEFSWPANLISSMKQIENEIYDEVMGLGPLENLLADPEVTEIMVNRRDQIFLEKKGKLLLSETFFSSDRTLLNVIERIVSTVGRRIDKSSPIVDARLIDGSRVNAVIPPLALKGPCLTIRRFSKKPIAPEQLIEWGSMTQEMHDLLHLLVTNHKNIMISGGTGSGKTTLLNALSSFIPNNERIVTIEDAAELQLQQQHVISLEARPANLEGKGAVPIRDLVKNSLRMRPDRIIVGECRGGEALDMLQAMNTGHDGSMTTAHANSPIDMLRRMETMVLMAGMDLPLPAIRQQIASALSVIVQQTRRKSGKRLVTQISWLRGLNPDGNYNMVDLYKRQKSEEVTVNVEGIAEYYAAEEISPASSGGH